MRLRHDALAVSTAFGTTLSMRHALFPCSLVRVGRQALQHASIACNRKLVVEWVASADLEEQTKSENPELHNKAWDTLQVHMGQGYEVSGLGLPCRSTLTLSPCRCTWIQVRRLRAKAHLAGAHGVRF